MGWTTEEESVFDYRQGQNLQNADQANTMGYLGLLSLKLSAGV
jgi:hypothetical protein